VFLVGTTGADSRGRPSYDTSFGSPQAAEVSLTGTTFALLVITFVLTTTVTILLGRSRTMNAATPAGAARPLPPPDNWSSDPLTSYLDLTRHQQFATFVNLHPAFEKMRDVDAAFVALHTDFTDPEDLVVPFFSTLTHAAYRGAAGLAMSTQSALAFAVMRQCLENCLYGLYVNQHPQSFETWIKRIESDAARQKMRAEFTIKNLRDTLQTLDSDTCQVWSRLYEKSIDYGAHPNPSALLSGGCPSGC
jgi:hypothetical protein